MELQNMLAHGLSSVNLKLTTLQRESSLCLPVSVFMSVMVDFTSGAAWRCTAFDMANFFSGGRKNLWIVLKLQFLDLTLTYFFFVGESSKNH